MALEEGVPMKQAHRIKVDTLREYFLDDPFKVYEKIQKKKEVERKDSPPPLPSKTVSAPTVEVVT